MWRMDLRQLRSTVYEHFEWVNMRVIGLTFLFVDHSSPFCAQRCLDKFCSSVCQSVTRVLCIKTAERIIEILSQALPNFRGAGLPKIVPTLSPLLRGTSSGKVS